MLGYPEFSKDKVSPPSLLYRLAYVIQIYTSSLIQLNYRLDDWSMGHDRDASTYFRMAGIDFKSKHTIPNLWCAKADWPDVAEQYRFNGKK